MKASRVVWLGVNLREEPQADNATLWVWGRVTSVIWYASWTIPLFVICNGQSRKEASDPEKCFINTADSNISSPKVG